MTALSRGGALSTVPNGGNTQAPAVAPHRRFPLALAVAIGATGLIVAMAVTPHTRYRVPAGCRDAATATTQHLTALTNESGTAVKVEDIRRDVAGLGDCR